ncbi:MAG: hypothetical protein JXR22_10150 [Prolixibacteraceae bacterium]|nr:hypothetical protein [Prolixibacteraceae bacterium]
MIRSIVTILLGLGLLFSGNQTTAKSKGKFNRYTQVTDKEILIESTRGHKVLFTAFDDHSIGVSHFGEDVVVKLISPAKILQEKGLNGSIYVEELDDLLQITTTNADGLIIKIDKKHFAFTCIDKVNQQEIITLEDDIAKVISNEKRVYVGLNQFEETDSSKFFNL